MRQAHQPLVPGEDDGVEHRFIEQTVAHPLADDDVHLLHGQLHLLHLPLEYGDDWKIRTPRPRFSGTLTGSHEHPTSAPDPSTGVSAVLTLLLGGGISPPSPS